MLGARARAVGHQRQLWERVWGREWWELSQGTSSALSLEAWGSLWGLSWVLVAWGATEHA